ncbi:Indole-3-glycerol phosphate synthase [hydrothermal vent metagenome]|uniref:indole-3-glycerol-phosphate synthase n=1 Tax=hydrothermal vent metagenome TaxID=652676 RepID=A0A3B1BFW8_9ZZZZ
MTMNRAILKILEYKRREIERLKSAFPLETLREAAVKRGAKRSLRGALTDNVTDIRIIAEIKRSSPSACFKPVEFDPEGIAKAYESAGAVALSVLTEARFFSGNSAYVPLIRDATQLPVLRKDFILDIWQVVESAALGADAILLMAVNFRDAEAIEPLYKEAIELGMEPLVEIHSEKEWRMVEPLKPAIVGINNRDFLSPDLKVDIGTTVKLAPLIPSGVTVVSESGISTREDIERLRNCGVHGFLVGSSLMKEDDPGKALKKLIVG